ncbi:hypothetical protein KR074_006905, partial [Drosophila pseudoananassae]
NYFSNIIKGYISINRHDDDPSAVSVGHDASVADTRKHEELSHNCLSSSVEYELAMILKELRWITDQV